MHFYITLTDVVLNSSDVSFLSQTSAQQALTGTINSSMQAVQAAQASLTDFDTLPPLGTDAVTHQTFYASAYYMQYRLLFGSYIS